MKKLLVACFAIGILLGLSTSAIASTAWFGVQAPDGCYAGGSGRIYCHPFFFEFGAGASFYGNLGLNCSFGFGASYRNVTVNTGIGLNVYDVETNDYYEKGYWEVSLSKPDLYCSAGLEATEGFAYGKASGLLDITSPVGMRLNGYFSLTPPGNEFGEMSGDVSSIVCSENLRLFIGAGLSYYLNNVTYYRSDSEFCYGGVRLIAPEFTLEGAVRESIVRDKYDTREKWTFTVKGSVSF